MLSFMLAAEGDQVSWLVKPQHMKSDKTQSLVCKFHVTKCAHPPHVGLRGGRACACWLCMRSSVGRVKLDPVCLSRSPFMFLFLADRPQRNRNMAWIDGLLVVSANVCALTHPAALCVCIFPYFLTLFFPHHPGLVVCTVHSRGFFELSGDSGLLTATVSFHELLNNTHCDHLALSLPRPRPSRPAAGVWITTL